MFFIGLKFITYIRKLFTLKLFVVINHLRETVRWRRKAALIVSAVKSVKKEVPIKEF